MTCIMRDHVCCGVWSRRNDLGNLHVILGYISCGERCFMKQGMLKRVIIEVGHRAAYYNGTLDRNKDDNAYAPVKIK